MELKLTRNWRGKQAGEPVKGQAAADALNEKAAQVEGRKPVEQAEKRPEPRAERR
jgi:hypothetical protein